MTSEIKEQDTRLSYSSSTLLQNCQRKYYFYKIKNVEPDPDVDLDSYNFKIGKAAHHVLDKTKHDLVPDENFKLAFYNALELNQLDTDIDAPLVHSILKTYADLIKKLDLKVIETEMKIEDKNFIGYVDAIALDKDSNFWIIDFKTSAMFTPLTAARLANDTQLNLYAYMHKEIAKQLCLKPNTFAGCRYHVVVKSRLKRQTNEAAKDYARRLYQASKAFEVKVPKDLLSPELFRERFDALYKLKEKYIKKDIVPPPNFTYCENYFKPCEYYSQCHGRTFTDACSLANTLTTSTEV